MAAPFYQNQHTYAVAVPTASGVDVLLDPGQAVQGTIYAIFAFDATLTLAAGPFVWPVLQYTWPGSGSGSGGTGTITEIIALSPISGGGTTGSVNIGLNSLGITGAYIANGTITANKLASNAAVTGILLGADTYRNVVELLEGTNVVLTSDLPNNQITIGLNPNAVIGVTATLPVVATTTLGIADISLTVTPAHDGGAVALQGLISGPTAQSGVLSVTDVYSNGFLSVNVPYSVISNILTPISSIYAQALLSGDYIFSGYSDTGVLNTYLTSDGTLFTSNIQNAGKVETDVLTLKSDPWVGSGLEKLHLTATGADAALNFINLPFSYYNTLTLAQGNSTPTLTGNGKIVGTPLNAPLISFNTTAAYPAIKLGTTSETAKDLALAVHNNGANPPTIGLYTDGTITCKRVDALFQTSTNKYLTAGNYQVSDYPGVSVFVVDSFSGPSSLQLPELTATSEDGMTFTFKKYDITIQPVLISTSAGQTIDNDQTQYTLTTYKQSHASTIGQSPVPILHTIKVMAVVKPLTSTYFWISL